MLLAAGQGSPAKVLYALVRSICACAAGPSARCWVPVITQGGKPVTVLPGLIAMSALMVPPMTHVNAVPAMIPFGAAAPRLMVPGVGPGGGGGGGGAVTVTVALPEIDPLVAVTEFAKVPDVPPAVNNPVALVLPPPFATDQTGVRLTALPPASLPTATYCCVAPCCIDIGFGVTVMVASGPAITMTVALLESVPLTALMVLG